MARDGIDENPTIDNWEDVPAFATEDEEAEFWATHGLGGAALESLGTFDDDALPPPRPRRRRFWRRIPVPLAATDNSIEKPVVDDTYARTGRVYRNYAA
jgi:hypothetical protein